MDKYLFNLLRKVFKNQLISGSFVMFVGSLMAGFGNYLYHLLMGRMLGPVNYGVLASLISIIYLLNIPVGTLNLVVVKFVSTLKGKKKFGEINLLFRAIIQKGLLYGLIFFLIYALLTPFFASFLHLDSLFPLLIVGGFGFLTVMLMINRATLQGLLRFGYLSASSILEVILKVAAAVFLVLWGFGVSGALWAFLIGGLFAYFFTFYPLRSLPKAKGKEQVFSGREMITFAVPVFLSTLAFTSLYTTDIILVRHFLEPQQAGFYSALATLGKIIYFVTLPIILVMFPMVSERHANGKKYKALFLMSLGIVGLVCLGVTLIYFLFPGLMVVILFGEAYLRAAPHLGLFGVFLSLYSFSFLLVSFYLSINKTKVVVFPIVAALVQIGLIYLFHQNLAQVVWVSIGVMALLTAILLLYYLQNEGKKIKEKIALGYRPRF